MKQLIIDSILRNWNKMKVNSYIMSDFAKILYKYIVLLKELERSSKIVPTIALMHENSVDWIAIYFACIIRNVPFIALPTELEPSELKRMVNRLGINYLFTTSDVTQEWYRDKVFTHRMLTLNGIYDIKKSVFISGRQKNYNILLQFQQHFDNQVVLENAHMSRATFKHKMEQYAVDRESPMYLLSAGVESETGVGAIVVTNMKSVEYTVRGALECISYTNSVYSNVSYTNSHIITLLAPFVRGCNIDFWNVSDTVFESTQSFEAKWWDVVDYLYEYKFWNWVFSKRWLKFVYNFIAKRKIRKYYGKDRVVIIYNSEVFHRALTLGRKALNLYTTYGQQELNQFVSVSDGTTTRTVGDVQLKQPKNEIQVTTRGAFDYYFFPGHETFTPANRIQVNEKWVTVYTGDKGVHTKRGVEPLGRLVNISDAYWNIQLDFLERETRGLPYIKECVYIVYKHLRFIQLAAVINERYVEAHGLSYGAVKYKLIQFLEALLEKLDLPRGMARVYISNEPLKKSFDGRVLLQPYRRQTYYKRGTH